MKKILALVILLITINPLWASEDPLLLGGRIGYSQFIGRYGDCLFEVKIQASGGNGNYSYTWQYKNNSGQWVNVGHTVNNYAPFTMKFDSPTQVRRMVVSNGQTAFSNTVNIYRYEWEESHITVPGFGETIVVDANYFAERDVPFYDESTVRTQSFTVRPDNIAFPDIDRYYENYHFLNFKSSSQDVEGRAWISGIAHSELGNNKPWSGAFNFTIKSAYSGYLEADNVYTEYESNEITIQEAAPAPSMWPGYSEPAYGGYSDNYQYWWESSIDNETWTRLTNPSSFHMSYNPGPMYTTTWFRYGVTDGVAKAYSSSLKINVPVAPITSGKISSDQSVYPGDRPNIIKSVEAPTGGGNYGKYVYTWEYSYDQIDWNAIPDGDNAEYRPESIERTTYFRRKVEKFNYKAYSNTIKITARLNPGLISLEESQNVPNRYIISSVSEATGGDGNVDYKWQIGTRSGKSFSWRDIPGETGAQYTYNGTDNIAISRIAISGNTSSRSNIVLPTVYVENHIIRQTNTSQSINDYSGAYKMDITYFDGLGFPIQNVELMGSVRGYDMITPVYYDELRRDNARIYLPYEASRQTGRFDSNMFESQKAYYSRIFPNEDEYYYSERQYDSSPFERLVATIQPGKIFRDRKLATRIIYSSNDVVAKFKVNDDSSVLLLDGNYVAGDLIKEHVNDEDARNMIMFRDKKDRVVVERRTARIDNVDTHYVYDSKDRLAWVIPAEASIKFISANQPVAADSDDAKELCYIYLYDNADRIVHKQIPGAGYTTYVYDKSDRVVMEQDASRAEGEWLAYEYDKFGRIASIYLTRNINEDRQTLQQKFDNGNYQEIYSGALLHQKNHYDNYNQTPSYLEFNQQYGYPAIISDLDTRVNGYKTYEKVAVFDGKDRAPNYIERAFYYDYKGNVIQTVERNHLGGMSIYSSSYTFNGQPRNAYEAHPLEHGSEFHHELYRTYNYDGQGKVTQSNVTQKDDDLYGDIYYTYNDLGQLIKIDQGDGADHLVIEKTYDLQGNVKEINNDFYKSMLRYFDTKKTGSSPSYTGNISEWEWENPNPDGSFTKYCFRYKYDDFGRLKDSDLYINNVLSNKYAEKDIRYDDNDNILSLKRYSDFNIVNDFRYQYTGNKLTTLSDIANTYNYSYFADGSLSFDGLRGVYIDYNPVKMTALVSTAGINGQRDIKAKYKWSASGEKLSVVDGEGTNGFEYLGSYVFKRDASGLSFESFAFDGGRVVPLNTHYYQTEFYIPDHLGNVRAIGKAFSSVAQGINNYYPFGKRFFGKDLPDPYSRYLYNGKELQTIGDFNYLDFGDRMYDEETGRWPSIDPLAEVNRKLSPYAFVGNNPIRNIDPDGRDWYSYNETYYDDDGVERTRVKYDYHRETLSDEKMQELGYTSNMGRTFVDADNNYYSLGGGIYNPEEQMRSGIVHGDKGAMAIIDMAAKGKDFWQTYGSKIRGNVDYISSLVNDYINLSGEYNTFLKAGGNTLGGISFGIAVVSGINSLSNDERLKGISQIGLGLASWKIPLVGQAAQYYQWTQGGAKAIRQQIEPAMHRKANSIMRNTGLWMY